MGYSPNIEVAVYQVLDEVMAASVLPRGAKAMIHSIIDDLHAASAPRKMIEHAESISVQLHYLESAVARRDAKLASRAQQQLRLIAAAWLNRKIRGPLQQIDREDRRENASLTAGSLKTPI